MKKRLYARLNRRNLVLGILGFLIFVMVIVGITGTYAFYMDSQKHEVLSSKIGDFSGDGESVTQGPLANRTTDVNVILYTQMPDNPNKYMETRYVPAVGYKVNTTASNCYPTTGSNGVTANNYSIKDDGTVTVIATESKPNQVVCRIYYDRDKLSDIVVYAMIQDAKGEKSYNGQKYKLTNEILDTYSFVGYTCSKNISTSIKYDTSTKRFTFITSGPNTCYAYFK